MKTLDPVNCLSTYDYLDTEGNSHTICQCAKAYIKRLEAVALVAQETKELLFDEFGRGYAPLDNALAALEAAENASKEANK